MRKRFDVVGLGALNWDYIVPWRSVHPEQRGAVTAVLRDTEVISANLKKFRRALDKAGQSGDVQRTAGGSAFNTMRALAALDPKLRLGYVGIGGRSPREGNEVGWSETLRALGIDDEGVTLIEEVGGCCLSYVDDDGDRELHTYYTDLVADALLNEGNRRRLAEYLSAARFIHVTSILGPKGPQAVRCLLREALEIANDEPPVITFDPGLTWSQAAQSDQAIIDIFRVASIVFVNTDELRSLGTPAEHLGDQLAAVAEDVVDSRATVVVVKEFDRAHVLRAAEDGADEVVRQVVLPNSCIADSTGAGDVFAAGMLAVATSQRGREIGGALLGLHAAREKLQHLGSHGYDALYRLFDGSKGVAAGRIFLSHAAADKDLVDAFVRLLDGLDVESEMLFCTSTLDRGLEPGSPPIASIRRGLLEARLVIMMVTPTYLKRPFCRYEAGAAWALGKDQIPLLGPGLEGTDIEQDPLLRDRWALSLENEQHLARFYESLVRRGFAQGVSAARWSSHVDRFLKDVRNLRESPDRTERSG